MGKQPGSRTILFSSLLVSCASPSIERSPAAHSCEPIDLRAAGQSMSGLPSGEQGDGYTCGFFAAASMVDAFRQSYLGEKISPDGPLPTDPLALAVDLAVERNRPIWLPFQLTSDPLTEVAGRHGSIACDMIRHVRKSGLCRNPNPVVYDRSRMTEESNRATRLYMALYRYGRTPRKKADRAGTVEEILRWAPEGRMTRPQIEALLEKNRRKPYRSVRELLYPHCEGNRISAEEMNLPRCRTRIFAGADLIGLGNSESDPLRTKRAERWIDRLFSRPRPQPILATHCYRVLQEGRSFTGSSPMSAKCILHHVNISGRRKKDGVCQYLIQNSYDPKDQYAVSNDWERDGNYFWVDAPPFERSLYSLQFFDRRDLASGEENAEDDAQETQAEAQLAEWERTLGPAR